MFISFSSLKVNSNENLLDEEIFLIEIYKNKYNFYPCAWSAVKTNNDSKTASSHDERESHGKSVVSLAVQQVENFPHF